MRKLFSVIAVLLALTLVGTIWFWLVEGWSLLDAMYMTVITLTTVGFQEVHPLSDSGRVFVMLFLICGLGVFLFSVVQLGEMVVRAELGTWYRRRGMNAALKSIDNHYIVCGFGRMGRTICQFLADRKLKFVVIDKTEEALSECETLGWPCIRGDATTDRTLLNAGIERARGIAIVLNSDADNLYVVLSARLLSRDLQIIARASDENSVQKMEKAGANRVVSPFKTGASKMAKLLVNPHVEDFFEIASTTGTPDLDLAEIHVTAETPCVNHTIGESELGKRGVIVVAIRRSDGEVLLRPANDSKILLGDHLITLGKVSDVSQFLKGEELT